MRALCGLDIFGSRSIFYLFFYKNANTYVPNKQLFSILIFIFSLSPSSTISARVCVFLCMRVCVCVCAGGYSLKAPLLTSVWTIESFE